MARYLFKGAGVAVRRDALLNSIPDDGCLMLFNADINAWYAHIYRRFQGVLSVHVMDEVLVRQRSRRGKMEKKFRDIYITWRD